MFKYLERLNKVVEEKANEIAYKTKDDSITYYDLWKKANILAVSLKVEGKSPVIIYGHKSIEMIISIIACIIANRAYVPVDFHTPCERIKEIVKLCDSTLLILNREISILGIKSMTIDEINEKFYSGQMHDTSLNNIAYIIFTSGTTGHPKGVPISYDNLENFVTWIFKMIPTSSCDRLNILNQASFSFDLSVADLYYSLFNGHTLVGLDYETRKDYDKIFKVLLDNSINLMVITPTFIKLLMLNCNFCEKNFPNLKCIYFCGEQLEVEIVKKIKERFGDIKIINAYGPTEATSAVCGVLINEQMLENKYLPVGNIKKSATKIKIVDGEIILEGKSVFNGYLNLVSENCFKENYTNCYKTGDLGIIKNDLLYFLGRKDEQVKYMGYRIELLDIQNNLLKINGVNEAVVIAKSDENTGLVKNIKAFVTVLQDINVKYIRDELEKFLPKYMIPKVISVIEKIPVNNNGKYDRRKLMEL